MPSFRSDPEATQQNSEQTSLLRQLLNIIQRLGADRQGQRTSRTQTPSAQQEDASAQRLTEIVTTSRRTNELLEQVTKKLDEIILTNTNLASQITRQRTGSTL